MAITTLFLDGFDHYVTADITRKWTTVSGASDVIIDTSVTRSGAHALRVLNGWTRFVTRTLPSALRTLVVGFAYRPEGSGTDSLSSVAPLGPLRIMSGSSGQLALRLRASNQLALIRGNQNGTILATSNTALASGTWYYLELRVYIDSTNGEYELRINGVTEFLGSGANTQTLTDNSANVIALYGADSGHSYFDDLYLRGAAGLEAGGFLGDGKIITRYPTSDGTYNQFARSAGTTNYENVDEATPDTADYIYSNTVEHKNTFGFAALADPGSVQAVQLNLLVNKETAGYRAVQPYLKSNTTEQAAALQAVSVDPLYRLKVWDQDPHTSDGWQTANLDSAEFGLEVG